MNTIDHSETMRAGDVKQDDYILLDLEWFMVYAVRHNDPNVYLIAYGRSLPFHFHKDTELTVITAKVDNAPVAPTSADLMNELNENLIEAYKVQDKNQSKEISDLKLLIADLSSEKNSLRKEVDRLTADLAKRDEWARVARGWIPDPDEDANDPEASR